MEYTEEWNIIAIHDVKFDTKDSSILQISSQEPSMSSKYGCVHDALIIMLGNWKFEYKWRMTNYVDSDIKFDIRDNPTLQNSRQELPTSSQYDCVLDAFLIMLGSWKLAYN